MKDARASMRLLCGRLWWAVVVFLFGVTLSHPAPAREPGVALLSWDATDRRTNTAAAGGKTVVYLTVDAGGAVDSLGFMLRWAARDAGARVKLIGLRPVVGRPRDAFTFDAGGDPSAPGEYHIRGAWLSDPGVLAAIREDSGGGASRYRVALDLELENVSAGRIQAANLAVRFQDGSTENLGSPAVSIGDGWVLRHPPVVSVLSGRLNRRFLQSTLCVRGIDLDRIMEIRVVDVDGRRCLPVRLTGHSAERIDMVFSNRAISVGPARLFWRDADCLTDSLVGAMEIAYLEEQLPGDTNLGVVPGRED